MKKILPGIFASTLLLILLNFPTFSKTSEVAYSQTTKDEYVSHPTPPSAGFNTYKNENYNLLIEYPKAGINRLNERVGCGSFIERNEEIIIDNLIRAQVLEWDRTLGEYLVSQGAQNMYHVSPIIDSGATQALTLEGLKKDHEAHYSPPLSDVSSIYLKDNKLFLISQSEQIINEGCVKQELSGWKPENHFRFY